MNFVYGAIGLVALAALAFWYRGQVYNQGFDAGQMAINISINKALEVERENSKKEADKLTASAKMAQDNLKSEIRKLRDIKDPTKCYVANLPDDMFNQLHNDYERLSN